MLELESAIRAGDEARVRTLLAAPDVRAHLDDALPSYGFGATPLIMATHFERQNIIEAILDAGANVNQRSHWWAGSFGVLDDDRGFADFFISRGAIVDPNAAAKLGRLDVLKQLVAADPNAVHARGGDGQTPLHVAASVEIAEFLLDHGADIDALDVDHESTPAQYLIRKHQDIVRYLITRRCRTDILMAAALGDLPLVRKHLDADPSMIAMAVDKKWFPMRNPRAGGTIYQWTLGGKATAHVVARDFGHEDVFRFLMDASPAPLKLAQASWLGDEALFNELVAAQPDLVQRLTAEEKERLVGASEHNNAAAVRMMVRAGWPVDTRGHNGETALHYAAWYGNIELVREILRHKPPLEVRDDANQATPINWAVHGSEHCWSKNRGDYPATIAALLEAGSSPPRLT